MPSWSQPQTGQTTASAMPNHGEAVEVVLAPQRGQASNLRLAERRNANKATTMHARVTKSGPLLSGDNASNAAATTTMANRPMGVMFRNCCITPSTLKWINEPAFSLTQKTGV